MKLISWNVNGLRACWQKGFADFLRKEDPDLFAVQETKMQENQFDEKMQMEGYEVFMNSAEKKGYSGTLIYSKKKPLSVSYGFPKENCNEGRVITLEFKKFYFVNAYVPNSKDGLARLDFRMQWEDGLRKYLQSLDQKKPVIYTGDLNVAHEECDIKNPSSNHQNAGFSDEERAKFQELLDAGFCDTFRTLYPEKIQYSWWSYRFHARENNAGWRIDYFLVSKRLMKKVANSEIFDTIHGSDHCPIVCTISLD